MSVILLENCTKSIVRLTLNRPEACNAFSTELLQNLLEHLQKIADDSEKRVVILRGAGKMFCGGLDLRLASTSENATQMAQLVADVLVQLRQKMSQVIIAAVHGAACAGGAALTLASDLIVAASGFRIGFPEVRRGLQPALLFPLLKRKLTDSTLRQLLLTGLPIDAERAKELGLLQYVVPDTELEDMALLLAEEICSAAEYNALRAAKQQLQMLDANTFETEMAEAVQAHLASWKTDAAQEGICAFLEKRPQNYT